MENIISQDLRKRKTCQPNHLFFIYIFYLKITLSKATQPKYTLQKGVYKTVYPNAFSLEVCIKTTSILLNLFYSQSINKMNAPVTSYKCKSSCIDSGTGTPWRMSYFRYPITVNSFAFPFVLILYTIIKTPTALLSFTFIPTHMTCLVRHTGMCKNITAHTHTSIHIYTYKWVCVRYLYIIS